MAIIINIEVMLAKRKMSVTELADKVGITMANISVLKNGKAKAIRLSTLEAICRALECQPAAIAFFTTRGMTVEGEMPIEGPWVDRVNGLECVQVDIVMMRTPDGHGRVELTKFRSPKLVA